MITAEGAGVIATVIPIGLIIIGFEIQRVPQFVATAMSATITLWVTGALLILGLILGFWSESLLLQAVAVQAPVPEVFVPVIWLALWLLAMGSFLLLLASLADRLGLLARLGRRAREATERSPRRLARQVRYVEKHHPSPDRPPLE